MTFPVDLHTVSVFLLVLARTASWAMTAPLFGSKGLAPIGRLAVAVSLAAFLTPLQRDVTVPTELGGFIGAALAQVAVGLALGFLLAFVFSAVEMAGSLADYASGFSYGALLDPVSGSQSAAFSRLTTVAFLALLFVTDGYQSVIAGFAGSFAALPVDALPRLADSGAAALLGSALTGTMVAALEIGAPLLGVLFLTEAALAIASRFVPQANAIAVGLPVKALVALGTAGAMLAMLPPHLEGLVDSGLRLGGQVIR